MADDALRGADAEQLLRNYLLLEFLDKSREAILADLASPLLDDKKRDERLADLRAMKRLPAFLKQLALTGKFEQEEARRKRSLADRVLRRA